MKRSYVLILFLVCLLPGNLRAQKIAVKSNLLYDATLTINAGLELGLGRKTTLELPVNYNGWNLGDARWRHWLIQPEFRYWFCERFNGHFMGIHGHYAEYNVGGINFNDHMKNNRYQGHLYGGGISYGYQWILGKRWSMEATVGVGYARIWDRRYPLTECGTYTLERNKNYFGPTKIGLTLIFVIN